MRCSFSSIPPPKIPRCSPGLVTEGPRGPLVKPAELETEEVAALENAKVASESAKITGAADFAALASLAEHLAVLETGERLVEKGLSVLA